MTLFCSLLCWPECLSCSWQMTVWRRILTPVQAARTFMRAYPWPIDVLTLCNALAESNNEPAPVVCLNLERLSITKQF